MTEVRPGGCACGAVRYQVRGEPLRVGLCHCTDCRKESGSIGLYYGDWPKDRFSSTGAHRTHDGRSFCPNCGSRLFHIGDGPIVEIMLGSLDDAPTGLVPTVEGWVKRREPWLAPVPGASQHREDV